MEKLYRYCSIQCKFKKLFYICDFEVQVGDTVFIPFGTNNIEKLGVIEEIQYYTESEAPYPVSQTKHVLRLFDVNDLFILSENKKKIVGFKQPGYFPELRIPAGVTSIDDLALVEVHYDTLIIPKSLRKLGVSTIIDVDLGPLGDTPKEFKEVIVEEGNKNFCVTMEGFYSISKGKKRLLRYLNKYTSSYVPEEGVTSFEYGAFFDCPRLKEVHCIKDVEEFNHVALVRYDSTPVDVYISNTVKKIEVFDFESYINEWRDITYHIEESNPYLFKDEDSIYKVLEDGTYKLVHSFYLGKGKRYILEGTSIIGQAAFMEQSNVVSIDFPDSLKIIEEDAFYRTGLQKVTFPPFLEEIQRDAFGETYLQVAYYTNKFKVKRGAIPIKLTRRTDNGTKL